MTLFPLSQSVSSLWLRPPLTKKKNLASPCLVELATFHPVPLIDTYGHRRAQRVKKDSKLQPSNR